MDSEFRADHESEHNFEQYGSELRQKVVDIQNFLTMAPVDFPHRNTLRATLSAIFHLTSGLGTEISRINEFEEKLNDALGMLHTRGK